LFIVSLAFVIAVAIEAVAFNISSNFLFVFKFSAAVTSLLLSL
jgi:hypothetical protein